MMQDVTPPVWLRKYLQGIPPFAKPEHSPQHPEPVCERRPLERLDHEIVAYYTLRTSADNIGSVPDRATIPRGPDHIKQ